MVQDYIVHYRPVLCTTDLHCEPWCTMGTYAHVRGVGVTHTLFGGSHGTCTKPTLFVHIWCGTIRSFVWGRHLAEVAETAFVSLEWSKGDTYVVEGDFSSATLKQGMWRLCHPIFHQQMFCGDVDPPFFMFKPAHWPGLPLFDCHSDFLAFFPEGDTRSCVTL